MAGASLLALLDDIATVLDDVSILTKVAAKKTAGVLGDDLALNAEQVSGVRAERELPVVWAVFKGSMVNKLILVPAALAISAFSPWLVVYLLIIGGLYLCFEGAEKVWHSFTHNHTEKAELRNALLDPSMDFKAFEKNKIKGAIRTDFILSAEIIVIALGTVSDASLGQQVAVVSVIALVMTLGVYGFVALIVKLDDMALLLMRGERVSLWARLKYAIGYAVLAFCPWLMKGLSVVGTVAMFLVGGGIFVHGIPWLHHLIAYDSFSFPGVVSVLFNLLIGVMVGVVLVFIVASIRRVGMPSS
ncbi:DUF808 domain-containing protein [Teredinibacter haidensis]|uniref:DUF808 domain-containing protein n=1 Tax=Teredinibacter haidensis TaxID=2731755 RepID=UPI0009490F72|nr:DUF808 domain-containing protein [Teredinibacter haidensis]